MTFLFAALVALIAIAAVRSRLPYVVFRSIITAGIFLPILATFYAIWRLWGDSIGGTELTLFVGLYIATGLGVSAGFHRMLSHGSFACGPVVKGDLLVLGSMAGQGRRSSGRRTTASTTRSRTAKATPTALSTGSSTRTSAGSCAARPPERERYCKRLLQDPLIVFIDRTAAVWVLLGLAIPFALRAGTASSGAGSCGWPSSTRSRSRSTRSGTASGRARSRRRTRAATTGSLPCSRSETGGTTTTTRSRRWPTTGCVDASSIRPGYVIRAARGARARLER